MAGLTLEGRVAKLHPLLGLHVYLPEEGKRTKGCLIKCKHCSIRTRYMYQITGCTNQLFLPWLAASGSIWTGLFYASCLVCPIL
jgi:hypothetical protein